MTYSTGSGDYVALMQAVLAHALTDGWTEINGVGSGWPIASPSGRIRGVDWSTYTVSEPDFTENLGGASKTQRYIRIGLGTDGASATANAAVASARVPNMAYTFTQWHIFSDPALNDHIHVVVEFSNGIHAKCYTHFSFGEIDKGGLGYHSVAYATASDRRAYAYDTSGGATTFSPSGGDWNTLNRCGNMWAGNWGENDDGWAATDFIVHSTNAPVPNGVAGWPAWDSLITGGANLWARNARQNDTAWPSLSSDRDGGFHNVPWWRGLNLMSGFVPLGPIPFILINGTSSSSSLRWLGIYPNVRFCSVENVNPGDELTFGAETWKLFPVTRATDWSQLNVSRKVTSGYAGYAYKKVP